MTACSLSLPSRMDTRPYSMGQRLASKMKGPCVRVRSEGLKGVIYQIWGSKRGKRYGKMHITCPILHVDGSVRASHKAFGNQIDHNHRTKPTQHTINPSWETT